MTHLFLSDGKIDAQELREIFSLLRHDTKKVQTVTLLNVPFSSSGLNQMYMPSLSSTIFLSGWSRRYHLGSRWWLWQVRQLGWVSGNVSSMQGRQNWYFVVRADIVAIPSLRVLQYIDHISGYEPRRLFNIVEFMMNDRDGSGSVSVEEAMQILYLRFGKGLLDTVIFKIVESLPLHHLILLCFAQQLEEIFGTSDTNSTKDLSLTEFLQSVTTSHVKQLRSKLASWCACPGIGHISKYIACNIMITSRHTWLLQGMTVCLWYILWDGSLPGKVLARAEILKMIKY
jgi:hypothetical protein